jgi:hypothetical protein
MQLIEANFRKGAFPCLLIQIWLIDNDSHQTFTGMLKEVQQRIQPQTLLGIVESSQSFSVQVAQRLVNQEQKIKWLEAEVQRLREQGENKKQAEDIAPAPRNRVAGFFHY